MNDKNSEETANKAPQPPPPREEKPRRTVRGFSDYPLEEKKRDEVSDAPGD